MGKIFPMQVVMAAQELIVDLRRWVSCKRKPSGEGADPLVTLAPALDFCRLPDYAGDCQHESGSDSPCREERRANDERFLTQTRW